MGADQTSRILATVTDWLTRLEAAAGSGDPTRLAPLFLDDAHWRDAMALTWRMVTVSGADAIAGDLASRIRGRAVRGLRVDPGRCPPRVVSRAGVETIEALIAFETDVGRCNGVVRFRLDGDPAAPARAWTLLTALDELRGHEEATIRGDREGPVFDREFHGPNWADRRREAVAYADRDPAVLIVGGGHAGLTIAARLGQLGVDALVVDRMRRVGDNWRLRYHGLKLHNQVHSNHLPYMPFPADLADLHSQGHGRQLAGTLRRGHGDQLLDPHRLRGGGLRRPERDLDRTVATRRRHGAGDAAASHRDGDQRQRHAEPAGHPNAGPLRRHRDAFQRVRRRWALAGSRRPGVRHRHQRPRYRPGPARQRRAGDDDPAQPDPGRQHRAERPALRRRLPGAGTVPGRSRPDQRVDAARPDAPRPPADHRRGPPDRQAAARRPGEGRVPAGFRRGRHRLAAEIPHPRRRLLLQRRLLRPDRCRRHPGGAVRRHRELRARRRPAAGRPRPCRPS